MSDDPSEVTLRRMTRAGWDVWYARQREGYLDQMVAMGGVSRADAELRFEDEEAALLPDGPATRSHHFFVAEVAGSPVGTLWLAEQRVAPAGSRVWVFSIEIEPSARGRGHGRAVMILAEQVARDLGHERIELNVFAGNSVAIGLYTSMGYRVAEADLTGQLMVKDL